MPLGSLSILLLLSCHKETTTNVIFLYSCGDVYGICKGLWPTKYMVVCLFIYISVVIQSPWPANYIVMRVHRCIQLCKSIWPVKYIVVCFCIDVQRSTEFSGLYNTRWYTYTQVPIGMDRKIYLSMQHGPCSQGRWLSFGSFSRFFYHQLP